MTYQNHTHKLDRAGTGRARSRRWRLAAGLAGVTGLALTTAGMAAASTADAVGRTVTTAQLGVDHPGEPIRDEPPQETTAAIVATMTTASMPGVRGRRRGEGVRRSPATRTG